MAALLCAAALTGPVPAAAQGPTSGVDRTAIDPQVRPQDDFYRHANGHWLKSTRFPPDKAYVGPVQQMLDASQTQLRELIAVARTHPDDAEATKLAALFARLGQIGVDNPIGMYIAQDDRDATRYVPALAQSGLGLPTRDYYLKLDDTAFRGVRAKYVAYLAQLLTLAQAGDPKRSGGVAEDILALETEIARVQWSPVENRDPVKSYNPIVLAELSALAPALDWPGYLAGAELA